MIAIGCSPYGALTQPVFDRRYHYSRAGLPSLCAASLYTLYSCVMLACIVVKTGCLALNTLLNTLSYAYINYAYLLRDEDRLDELERLLNSALKIKGMNKCNVYDEFGSLYELQGDYKKAILHYKKAITYCLNDKIVTDLHNHIKRCKKKASLFSRWGFFRRKI